MLRDVSLWLLLACFLTVASCTKSTRALHADLYDWTDKQTGIEGELTIYERAQNETCPFTMKLKIKGLNSAGKYVVALYPGIRDTYAPSSYIDGCKDPRISFTKIGVKSRMHSYMDEVCIPYKDNIRWLVGTFVGIGEAAICEDPTKPFIAYGVVGSYQSMQANNENITCFLEPKDIEGHETEFDVTDIPISISITYVEDHKRDNHKCVVEPSEITRTDWNQAYYDDQCLDYFPGTEIEITRNENMKFACVFTRTSADTPINVDPALTVGDLGPPAEEPDNFNTDEDQDNMTTAPTGESTKSSEASSTTSTTSSTTSSTVSSTTSSEQTPITSPTPTDATTSSANEEGTTSSTDVTPTVTGTIIDDNDIKNGTSSGKATPPGRKGLIVGIVFASLILAGMVFVMVRKNKLTSRSDGFKRMYGDF